VAVDSAGNVFSTGKARAARGDYSFHTIKYARRTARSCGAGFPKSGGRLQWPIGVVADSAGNCIVAGTSTVDNLTTTIYTAKYAAADGAILWEKRSPAPDGNDTATGIAIDGSDNVVVTGTSDRKNSHDADYYTVKYAGTDGHALWSSGSTETSPAAETIFPQRWR